MTSLQQPYASFEEAIAAGPKYKIGDRFDAGNGAYGIIAEVSLQQSSFTPHEYGFQYGMYWFDPSEEAPRKYMMTLGWWECGLKPENINNAPMLGGERRKR